MTPLKVITLLSIGLLVIMNDMFDFIEEMAAKTATKIIFAVIFGVALLFLINSGLSTTEGVKDQIHDEKKAAKKVFKRNLNTF